MPIRMPQLLLLAYAASAASWGTVDPFVGKWKLNGSKTTFIDVMKIAPAGTNKYAFSFEGGPPETIVADGTGQPGSSGTTLSATIEAPDRWTIVRNKADGDKVLTAHWTLGADGQTLTDAITTYKPDGSPMTVDYHYARTAGGPGIPGTWQGAIHDLNLAYALEIRPYEAEGLTLDYTTAGRMVNLRFDGKDYPRVGPNATAGSVTSGRRVNERTLELTNKVNGRLTDTQRATISSDLNTLTLTVLPVGQSRPNVLVFDRE